MKLCMALLLTALAFAHPGPVASPAVAAAAGQTSAEAASGTTSPEQTGSSGEEEPLDVFVPSEKLPADAAISFPVDI